MEPSTCYVGRHLRGGEASIEEERHPSGIQRLQGSPTGSGVAKGRDLFREESLDQFTIHTYIHTYIHNPASPLWPCGGPAVLAYMHTYIYTTTSMQCIASSSKSRFQDHTIRGGVATRDTGPYMPYITCEISLKGLRALCGKDVVCAGLLGDGAHIPHHGDEAPELFQAVAAVGARDAARLQEAPKLCIAVVHLKVSS